MMANPPGVCDRSLEEVSAMVTHAKLIESDLLPLSQVVRYLVRPELIPGSSYIRISASRPN